MELIVKYIAKVDVATGQIQSVGFTPGHIPPEGISDGIETIHLRTEDWRNYDNNLTIHEEFYRKEGAWVHRGARPNKYYQWSVETEQWVFSSEHFWGDVRAERNIRLARSDWTQFDDAPITETQQEEWKSYRTVLRDLPKDNIDVQSMNAIPWPTPPNNEKIEITVW